ncbi:hypothetical protein TTHERM_00378460 (macronuclear) [Tetrahymena thermophila SB210]|uniref:Uncharacterized protein n=1 Tax=Tetrahymena thermophila (strain SB210) TaxID=312017 RepID=Q23FH1_TETTS|nr:hypothetical protein TTHERM_00378460 [Tetrahymena thermophila SB210]EAR95182.1 hypothetical protein TTHERM_00378460 [Tetrahymena thermophila SB210]|eukprot:XP_001015427.1 hypothetical protein TTHERM_00378460 [Tetrahymena thermophila SB210]
MQSQRIQEVKNQGNWNKYFPNPKQEVIISKQHRESSKQKNSNNALQYENRMKQVQNSQDLQGDYFYAEINQMIIPIPQFISIATKIKLNEVIQDIQQEMDKELSSLRLKQQILAMLHKNFVNRNQELFQRFNSQPNNEIGELQNIQQPKIQIQSTEKIQDNQIGKKNKQKTPANQEVNSNPSLKNHIEKEDKLFQQNLKVKEMIDDNKSYKSNNTFKSEKVFKESLIQRYQVINSDIFSAPKANDFKKFVNNIFVLNMKSSNQLYNDIQQQINKQNNRKSKNLFCQVDYMYDAKFIEETLNSIYQFGVDTCTLQKKQNQVTMSETINIKFKERTILKTITYSILYHNLCKQAPNQAKEYIYTFLCHLNPNSKGFEQENYILRQLYLHFLQIIINSSDHSETIAQFLDSIFKYEFLSSLMCDHLLFSAQKILKIQNKINQNNDLNNIIEQLSKANEFDLYLLCNKLSDNKKYSYAKHESREIFIIFEQSMQQHQSYPVYYVINPSDSFICQARNI